MRVIEPYARLMDVPDRVRGIELLQKIEWAGRISHRSEDAQSADSWQRFVSAVVLGHGDWSIVEHATATVDCYVDRGITHEIVRHRLFAFTQESTRFVNYEKKDAAILCYARRHDRTAGRGMAPGCRRCGNAIPRNDRGGRSPSSCALSLPERSRLAHHHHRQPAQLAAFPSHAD